MYCIKCGIELSPGQAVCPICCTKVCHPDFPVDPEQSTYPVIPFQSEEFNRTGLMFVLTVLSALTAIAPVLLEYLLWDHITWSGYVTGSILLVYIWVLLPLWFKNPNPVIFAPCDFAAIGLFLLYVNEATGGDWFLSFAFPVTGILCLLFTALITLLRYIHHGRLYIVGGWLISLGVYSVLLEFFIWFTFDISKFYFWSLYPLVTFFTLGMALIVIAIVKPMKESLRKYFHI